MERNKLLFDPEGLLNPGVLINPDPKTHVTQLKTMPLADPLIDLCIECGFCEPACPSHHLTFSPRQRIAVTRERARLRQTGENPELLALFDEGFKYPGLDTCAACNLCSLRCPVGIETGTRIIKERGERRSDTARSVAHFMGEHSGLVEGFMDFGVATQAVARKVVGNAVVDGLSDAARKATGNRIPRVGSSLVPGPKVPKVAAANPHQDPKRGGFPVSIARAEDNRIVYFSSCATRMFGAAKTDLDLIGTPEAMVALLKRAGYDPVVPEHLDGQCCGQPFLSKGFPEEATKVGGRTDRALQQLSGDGALPVVTDASTCAKHFGEHAQASVLDSAEFLVTHVLPRLKVTRKLPVVAVHHNCSAQRLKEQKSTEALAAAMEEKVAQLETVT
jgi:D-lactate dehydrogenase